MKTFENIEDVTLAKRVADILDGTTMFANQADRLAALAVAAFESRGVESMYQLVIEESLLSWGLTVDESAAAVKAAFDAGTLTIQDSDQFVRNKLV